MSEQLVLTFGVGGYCKGNQTVKTYQLEDGSYRSVCTRIYSSFLGSETEEVVIDLEKEIVQEFFVAAQQLGVFEWEPKYYAKCLDGQDWELEIDHPDYPKVKCRGLSAHPSAFYDLMDLLSPLGLK